MENKENVLPETNKVIEPLTKELEGLSNEQLNEFIQKHSKDFGGSLDSPDVIKLCGCSRNSYYKYKRELKTTA